MVYRVPTIHIFISVFFIDIGENSKHILYGSSKLFRRKNKNKFIFTNKLKLLWSQFYQFSRSLQFAFIHCGA